MHLLCGAGTADGPQYCRLTRPRVPFSPDDKLGVATLAAGVQRAGGSVRHPTSKLDDALEAVAAYVEVL